MLARSDRGKLYEAGRVHVGGRSDEVGAVASNDATDSYEAKLMPKPADPFLRESGHATKQAEVKKKPARSPVRESFRC